MTAVLPIAVSKASAIAVMTGASIQTVISSTTSTKAIYITGLVSIAVSTSAVKTRSVDALMG